MSQFTPMNNARLEDGMAPSSTRISHALHPTRIWEEGGAVMVEITDTFLGTVQHTTMQEAINDATSRFRQGTLPVEGLTTFSKAFYSLYVDIVSDYNA